MFIINFFKKGMEWLGFFQKSANIVFLGLDNAGKTTMLYMLQHDRFTETDSTYHPHQAEVTIGNIKFNSYDLGGHQAARKTWREYCGTLDGIIFMIDSAQQDRLTEAKSELDKLLEMPELSQCPFVIFGNKVDKEGALTEDELREILGLQFHKTYGKTDDATPGARPIEMFMCSVLKRVGYQDGFQWLSKFIK